MNQSVSFEENGLILPGDESYGSPLSRDQQLVVEIHEELFPGTKEYLEELSYILRLNPSHETHKETPVTFVSADELHNFESGAGTTNGFRVTENKLLVAPSIYDPTIFWAQPRRLRSMVWHPELATSLALCAS